MPTDQHRVTCTRCGAKRIEKFMYVNRDFFGRQKRFGHYCKYASINQQNCVGVLLLQLADTPIVKGVK